MPHRPALCFLALFGSLCGIRIGGRFPLLPRQRTDAKDQIAEAEFTRDHFCGNEREPSHADGNLQAGDYTLEVSIESGEPSRHQITVPAPDYDFTV